MMEEQEVFFDVRKHKPVQGQVLAKYSVMCEFVDGPEKRTMINLLRDTEKTEPAVMVMRKLHFACERDAIRVPLAIVRDLCSGMSVDDVAVKPYEYQAEFLFYTLPTNVPRDDPHWQITPLEFIPSQ